MRLLSYNLKKYRTKVKLPVTRSISTENLYPSERIAETGFFNKIHMWNLSTISIWE